MVVKVTLLCVDGQRCHLEGGVPVTGSDRGPPELHSHCVNLPCKSTNDLGEKADRISIGPLEIGTVGLKQKLDVALEVFF